MKDWETDFQILSSYTETTSMFRKANAVYLSRPYGRHEYPNFKMFCFLLWATGIITHPGTFNPDERGWKNKNKIQWTTINGKRVQAWLPVPQNPNNPDPEQEYVTGLVHE